MRSETCLMCGAALSLQDRWCHSCGTTAYEYPEPTEVEVYNGKIRILSNYRDKKKELERLVETYAETLYNVFVFDETPLKLNVSSEELLSIQKYVFKVRIQKNIYDRLGAFIDELRVKTSIEKIDEFFMQNGLVALNPVYDLKTKIPVTSTMLSQVELFGNETNRIIENFCNAIERMRESSGRNSQSFNHASSPLIVANSWTAVAINDINLARERNETAKWGEYLHNSFGNTVLFYQSHVHEMKVYIKQFVNNIKEFIYKRFEEQIISMEGAICNDPSWINLIENPFNSDAYVKLIMELPDVKGIRKLISVFEMDASYLFQKCIDLISSQVVISSNIRLMLDKQANVLNNCEECFLVSSKSILKTLCDSIIRDRKKKLITLSEHLDSNQVRAGITASQMVERIISKDDFCYLATIDSQSLVLPLAQKLNQADQTPANIYSSLIDCVQKRLNQIASIQQERDACMRSYDEQEDKLNCELSQAGFFQFSKKKELRAELERICEEHKKASTEYNKRLEDFF